MKKYLFVLAAAAAMTFAACGSKGEGGSDGAQSQGLSFEGLPDAEIVNNSILGDAASWNDYITANYEVIQADTAKYSKLIALANESASSISVPFDVPVEFDENLFSSFNVKIKRVKMASNFARLGNYGNCYADVVITYSPKQDMKKGEAPYVKWVDDSGNQINDTKFGAKTDLAPGDEGTMDFNMQLRGGKEGVISWSTLAKVVCDSIAFKK
ncbi:MAG: hypothetical protein LIP02_02870 [Bacteroidales bacterium]|nr:hypothetical protein [Bacteroidales bacterium]